MLHLVFEPGAKEIIQKSFEMDMFAVGDLFAFQDDYSFGVLGDITSEFLKTTRKPFYDEMMNITPHAIPYNDIFDQDKHTIEKIKCILEQNVEENIWLWVSPNVTGICGYYVAMSILEQFIGRIYVLFFANLPFLNTDKKVFYPKTIQEIPYCELLKVRKIARAISVSEWEIDKDEWKKMCEENMWLRIWEGSKNINSVNVDFLDKDIIKYLPPVLTKGHKVLSHIIQKLPFHLNEHFITWRLYCLAQSGNIQYQGNWKKGIKDIELMQ